MLPSSRLPITLLLVLVEIALLLLLLLLQLEVAAAAATALLWLPCTTPGRDGEQNGCRQPLAEPRAFCGAVIILAVVRGAGAVRCFPGDVLYKTCMKITMWRVWWGLLLVFRGF